MAKTSTIDTPDELKNLQKKAHEQRDRYILGVLQGHKHEPSKRQKRLLRRAAVINSPQEGRGSLFKYLAPFWHQLNDTQQNVWREAAAFSDLTNWQLFISDNAARIRNDLALSEPPSDLWQVRTGYINIEAPASQIILKQEHPLDYWVTQKVPGSPWKEELVRLTETFSLPLEIAIRYKSNLIAEGAEQYARLRARVWSSYQGVNRYTDFSVDFGTNDDWTLKSTTANDVIGHIVGYTLYLEIVGYRGTLLFDNIRAVHGGTNWARDPRCDDVERTFTEAFAVVPPFWIPEALPAGSSFSTQYPPALS